MDFEVSAGVSALPWAQVRLITLDEITGAWTDERGRVAVSGPVGTHALLTVPSEGFDELNEEVVFPGPGEATLLKLSMEAAREPGSLALAVHGSGLRVFEGAVQLDFYLAGGERQLRVFSHMASVREGSAMVSDVPSGVYWQVVRADDSTALGGHTVPWKGSVDVVSGEASSVQATLEAGGRLRLQVRSPFGEPLPAACEVVGPSGPVDVLFVCAYPSIGMTHRSPNVPHGTTEIRGVFAEVSDPIPVGEYVLRFRLEGYLDKQVTLTIRNGETRNITTQMEPL